MIDSLSPAVLTPLDSPRSAAGTLPTPAASPDVPAATGSAPGDGFGRSWRTTALIFVFSAVLALATFALDGRNGLNLADEGFLRYGVHAIVAHGEVPLRDFQSYDPGRYYWAAGWSLLLGDGIVTTRLACTLFQVLGVGFGLLALRRTGAGWSVLVTTGLIVTFWMLERFKLYEQCISLAALYPAVRLTQQPDRRNAFLAGVFVGLAAFFGRNHGFYNVVAFGGLLALLAWKYRRLELLKLTLPWAGGIVVGYLPMLLMLAFVPGFFAAFVDSLHMLARAKTTNLSIPVPWPWKLNVPAGMPWFLYYCVQASSWCFVLLTVAVAGLAALLAWLPGSRWRAHAGMVAAAVIAIPYAHYAFSRADAPHLAHSMPILAVALLGLAGLTPGASAQRTTFAAIGTGLGLLTLLATLTYNPVFVSLVRDESKQVEVTIGEETLILERKRAALVTELQRWAKEDMAAGENVLILPDAPTLYEVVGRQSPVEEIYYLWPQLPETERGMISALEKKNVNWVLLRTEGLDKVRERNLRSTHPLLMQYLSAHFQPVSGPALPYTFVLLHRTNPVAPGQP